MNGLVPGADRFIWDNLDQLVPVPRARKHVRTAGGPGSGDFGHSGRPGAVGGSGGQNPSITALPKVEGILAAIDKPDGGFTYHALTGEQPSTGFALSIHRDREQVIDDKDATLVALAKYAKKNEDLLSQTNNYMGGWHNPEDGKVYLDVSTVVHTAAEAERMARKARQLAYFDLVQGVLIKLKYEDEHELKAAESIAQSYWSEKWDAFLTGLNRAFHAFTGTRADSGGTDRSAEDFRELGGKGSGNFGHAGREGKVGGSSTYANAKQRVETTREAVAARFQQLIAEGKATAESSVSDVLGDATYKKAYDEFLTANREMGKLEQSTTERVNSLTKESKKLERVVEQAENDRNAIKDRLREEAYTPDRTVADIEKIVYTHPDYVEAEKKLMDAAEKYSATKQELWKAESEMRVDVVERRATDIAEQMGIDPTIIHVIDKEPTPFVVGNQQFHEAGHFDPSTGQIEVNARNSYDMRMAVTNGIVAHELSHEIFHTVTKAQEVEHSTIDSLPDAEKERLFEVSKWFDPKDTLHVDPPEIFIHGAKTDKLSELRERFPASAAWADTWGDRYLTPKADDNAGPMSQSMINENGHSAYARSYWTGEALRDRGRGSYNVAINETLAEVTRYLVQPSSWSESGQPAPKSKWVKLSQSLRAAYPKVKAKR